MSAIRSSPTIAIVGAGAAGTLTAAHLAAAATRELGLLLVDPRPSTGRGTAYATPDARHRLNVPATKMSAWPDDPDHFARWLGERVEFPARAGYGSYLAAVLDEALAAASGRVTLERRYERATGLSRHGSRLRLRLGTTGARTVDAVVLAIGTPPPSTRWVPAELAHSPRFVADPWRVGALDRIPPGAPVLLVGTGLTMVDAVLSLDRPGRVLHAVSRHGTLPAVHVAGPLPPYPPPVLQPGELRLSTLRAAVRRHLCAAVRELGDWRPAVDSLRPVTAELWGRLSEVDRVEFLREDARWWEVHRHRMPPDVGARIAECLRTGRLVLRTGSVSGATRGGEVTLSDGTRLRDAAVVNCTGPDLDLRRSDDPLVLELLATGGARPGPLGLGLETDGAGRVAGTAAPLVWTLGAPRRGELWETTAIPEIRGQAAGVAAGVLAALSAARRAPRPRDPYGLPLSTTAEAADTYAEGLRRVLCLRSGADTEFRAAVERDPGFALAHAALALLGAEWDLGVDAGACLARAEGAVERRGDERERSFVRAVGTRVRGGDATSALVRHIDTYPEDALAVSVVVPTIAFGGATTLPEESRALVEGLAPTYGDDWWYSGLLAFVRQEQERWDEAAGLAEQALAVEPRSGHAVHARAHVYYETGAHEHGLAFLDPWIVSCGDSASHRAHFSWHAALHELALGNDEAVRRRYARELAPPGVQGVRALVDSASLLWRCALVGGWDRPPVRDVLAMVDPALLTRPPTPFVAMHAAMALAAVGDTAGLARLRAHAAARADLRDVIEPLTGALVDLVEGRCAAAAGTLWSLQERVPRVGGSAAQREVVEETLLYALVQAGRRDRARALLQRRLDRRPSTRDRARLRHLQLPPSVPRQ
jgi:uncharacterized NAD(P)/FAD-binding protein YdhS